MNGQRDAGDGDIRDVSLTGRLAAADGQLDAVLAEAATRTAVHCPPITQRDPELVQIHAEAGRFFQACLKGSWVPGYLASRRLDAALLPTSPWKIGYAPFSLLCCRGSLTVLSRSARVFVDLHLIDNSSYLPRSWS
jgi:hypothetical protein